MRISFRLRWPPALLWATAIFYLSSQSRPLGRRWPSQPSALAHVFEFAVLAALLRRALATEPQRRQRAVAPALVLTALYAASDEVHQLLVPGRTASLSEYGLDLLGASLGVAVSEWWGRLPSRRSGAGGRPS
jgi:VanZ family protein